MTVPVSSRRNDYVGNGATATYSYTFRILDDDDLIVSVQDTSNNVTKLTKTTDYTVLGVGLFSGGSITFVNAGQPWLTGGNLKTSYKLTIRGKPVLEQPYDAKNRGGFFPEDHETVFDRLAQIDIGQQDEINRALRFPETDGVALNAVFPPAAARANKFCAFDAAGGGPGAVPVSAFMETVLDDTAEAAARKTLKALGSEMSDIKTASYTVIAGDHGKIIPMDASGGSVTVTLPDAATVGNGFAVTICKADRGQNSNAVNITGVSGQRFGYDGPQFNISGAVNNGSGLIRLTTSTDNRIFTTGERVVVAGVVGTTEANGTWTVTRVSMTQVDLQGSTFTNAYTSGGTITLIRETVKLRVSGSFVTLVSDGTRWVPVNGSPDILHWARDVLFHHNNAWAGFGTNNSVAAPIDFWWDAGGLRLHARSFIASETGDAPELAIQRADVNASSTYPDGPGLLRPAVNTNMGLIHWRGWASDGSPSWANRSAQLYVRAAENIAQANNGGRLIIATTPIGTNAGAIDRLEIDDQGRHLINTTRNSARVTEDITGASDIGLNIRATNGAYAGNVVELESTIAGAGTFYFLRARSNIGGTLDEEFLVRGDGTVFSDAGTAMSSPADYAEMVREWWDGNPNHEDRSGCSVVLVDATDGRVIRPGDSGHVDTRIRLANSLPHVQREAIIGVVSANPAVKGAAAWNHWIGKYEKDAYGRYVMERCEYVTWTEHNIEYRRERGPDGEWITLPSTTREIHHTYPIDQIPKDIVVPPDAKRVAGSRRKLNPAYDPSRPYIQREDRPEWDYVGLLGRLPLRAGEPTHPRWVMTGRLTDEVNEWLVR
ncbi:MAG TPA: peptidase G2 autoproteolytic cleavage domain-containing protein [Burkholderiaceae bacterium]|nr:peptidase G2 autoproteolytic cleavage domain-containing protein [Burkholderiaceae bacterium]